MCAASSSGEGDKALCTHSVMLELQQRRHCLHESVALPAPKNTGIKVDQRRIAMNTVGSNICDRQHSIKGNTWRRS
jgi:hypothetical protein